MKRAIKISLVTTVFLVFSLMLLAGCGNRSGSTIDEPEITAEYLIEDYSQQLITDGGHNFIGSVVMEKLDETYLVHFTEKEVVSNAAEPTGYYIAETNVTLEATLGSDARFVCIHEGEAEVSNANDFMKHQKADDGKLYSVYFLGTSAELIIEVDPATVIGQ